jgi:hypothetical protein
MKSKFSFLFVLIACYSSCIEDAAKNNLDQKKYRDLKKEYVLSIVDSFFNKKKGNDNCNTKLIYFLYPNFCGSCSDSVKSFVNSNPLKVNSCTLVVLAENDSSSLKGIVSNESKYFVNMTTRAKYGLGPSTDKIFILKSDSIIYSSQLTFESIESVRQYMISIK